MGLREETPGIALQVSKTLTVSQLGSLPLSPNRLWFYYRSQIKLSAVKEGGLQSAKLYSGIRFTCSFSRVPGEFPLSLH